MNVKKYHTLIRTSPIGHDKKFVGNCIQCGKKGLTLDDLKTDLCANPMGMTENEAMIELVLPRDTV